MAKIHISSSIAVFLCILAVGQKLVTSETCILEKGCSPSDFDCWYDCKHQYGGKGGCTNKDFVLNRATLLPQEDDDSGYCCHCHCKFESKPNEACPASPPGVQPPI